MRTPSHHRIVTVVLAVALWIGAAWALAHCGDSVSNIGSADTGGGGETKKPCINNAQCTGGQVCKDKFCTTPTKERRFT